MYLIRLQKKKNLKTKINNYWIVLILKKKSVSSHKIKIKLGIFIQKQNRIILNLNNFIYWINKGVNISNKVYKLLKISSNFISNPKNQYGNFKYNKKK